MVSPYGGFLAATGTLIASTAETEPMTVISTTKDDDALTLTLVAEFDAPPERVWRIWEDPRLLEQWWGPPGWPATFDEYEFAEGGGASYHMTGPAGEESRGWWRFLAIEAPRRLELDDGFADEHGEPVSTMEPMRMVAMLEPIGDRTRMTVVSTFSSLDQYKQMLDMGMEEGMRQAVTQIDEIVAR